MCLLYVFCILYFIFCCILCSKAIVRAHLSLVCLVQLPGLLCYRIIVLLLLNKINDDDDIAKCYASAGLYLHAVF